MPVVVFACIKGKGKFNAHLLPTLTRVKGLRALLNQPCSRSCNTCSQKKTSIINRSLLHNNITIIILFFVVKLLTRGLVNPDNFLLHFLHFPHAELCIYK